MHPAPWTLSRCGMFVHDAEGRVVEASVQRRLLRRIVAYRNKIHEMSQGDFVLSALENSLAMRLDEELSSG